MPEQVPPSPPRGASLEGQLPTVALGTCLRSSVSSSVKCDFREI